MNINFAPIDEAYIKGKVEAGYYNNPTELIRDAIRRMREAEEEKNEFYAAILVAEAQIVKGQVKPYTAGLIEEIKQNALRRAANGEKPSSDVIPQ